MWARQPDPIRVALSLGSAGSRAFGQGIAIGKDWCWSLDDARFPTFEEQRRAQLLNQAARAPVQSCRFSYMCEDAKRMQFVVSQA